MPANIEQLSTSGPLVLSPRAALTMGMVLHELCTNAAKHGPLADPTGKWIFPGMWMTKVTSILSGSKGPCDRLHHRKASILV